LLFLTFRKNFKRITSNSISLINIIVPTFAFKYTILFHLDIKFLSKFLLKIVVDLSYSMSLNVTWKWIGLSTNAIWILKSLEKVIKPILTNNSSWSWSEKKIKKYFTISILLKLVIFVCDIIDGETSREIKTKIETFNESPYLLLDIFSHLFLD
jgi:hypothetical protein